MHDDDSTVTFDELFIRMRVCCPLLGTPLNNLLKPDTTPLETCYIQNSVQFRRSLLHIPSYASDTRPTGSGPNVKMGTTNSNRGRTPDRILEEGWCEDFRLQTTR